MGKTITSVLILAALFLVSMQPYSITAQFITSYGSRSDLRFAPYSNQAGAYAALKAGDVDLMCWSLTADQVQDAINDTNLQLAAAAELGVSEFDFNNNYTITDYTGIRSPMSYTPFRQALAHAVDKNWIITEILGDLGDRIDVPIPSALTGWWNTSVTCPPCNYPYAYSPTQAAAVLDAAGFVQGTTINPYYDITFPGSAEYIRTYPPDHPQKPSQDLDPLEVVVRTDDIQRLEAGRLFYGNMRKLGIPVNPTEGDAMIIYFKVFVEKSYHIYTGAWRVSRFPPRSMFSMFHSTFWCTHNWVTGMNSSGLPNYPDLDEELEKAYYAPDYETAMFHCKNAQGLLVDKYCVSVWLWSPKSWYAYRNLLGVANMDGCGINNKYTYLNALRVDNSSAPIRVAIQTPNSLNILYSQWHSDWQVLNAIYTHLMNVPPYDLSIDQPWVAQDWEVGNWSEPTGDEPKTNATFWIRKDVGIVAPITGDFMRNYTAHDVAFTIWYHYAFSDCWNWDTVSDMHHTRIVDDYTIEVYFDEYSYWLVYGVGMDLPLLPRDELTSQLCFLSNNTFSLPAISASTKYQFTDQQVIQMVALSRDEGFLVEGVDYEIVVNSTEHCHNVIHFLMPQPAGTYYATYYTPKWKPTGYYLGSDQGLNWTDTMYSLAPHYPHTSPFDLKANHRFFLETPPLGEIDFVWKWESGQKPRGGYFKIDIYDIVLAASAYGSTGNGVPDPNWRPGADLAPPECIVNIFDIVTIAAKYGDKFGHPPEDS